MNILFLPDQFAYVQFHLVIILSLVVSKFFYREMKFISFNRYFKTMPVILFFIIWDVVVTNKWWHFNTQFVLEVNQTLPLILPIEEVLFFFTVPFALLTFFENLRTYESFQQTTNSGFFNYFLIGSKVLIFLLLIISFFNSFWYTFTILLMLLLSDFSYFKKAWVQIGFYFLLFTTLVFNYYLTYLPVVLYTIDYKSNILVGTIPLEDFGYAVILFLWIIRTAYADKEP